MQIRKETKASFVVFFRKYTVNVHLYSNRTTSMSGKSSFKVLLWKYIAEPPGIQKDPSCIQNTQAFKWFLNTVRSVRFLKTVSIETGETCIKFRFLDQINSHRSQIFTVIITVCLLLILGLRMMTI